MSKINFKIATPERVVYKDEVDQITVPTMNGEITILPNHIPLISVLDAGEIVVKIGEEEILMAVSGGFIEVLSTKVVVLADTAEKSDEIDVARAEEAIKRAEELKTKRSDDTREFVGLSAQIQKELARIRVGRKHRERVEKMGAVDKYKKID
ncbi:F0F1 ATP synthase subunit epsilon [Candidatus Falkowbacteria bacterium]|jgi:F-type H+-transporting ATPase subunit epsilon|nr:F0F1 ATP synthase subunit epsilon [Candidatus Falkowbacteria bacterium]MBT7007821.1 F0F1 ATP synthase subunit epsilon [Candidatus Falkowbacteria bacterium]